MGGGKWQMQVLPVGPLGPKDTGCFLIGDTRKQRPRHEAAGRGVSSTGHRGREGTVAVGYSGLSFASG